MESTGDNVRRRKNRWVVKVGSQMVQQGGPVQIRSWMYQVQELQKNHNIEVIWVTSGAIVTAVRRTDFKKSKTDWTVSEKQALSAVGQPLLMDLYNVSLHSLGMLGAQVLLSYEDVAKASSRKNFSQTLENLLKWKIIPVVNENDAVGTDEIKFGDNDSLSAKVAALCGASRLIFLTDVPGVYESDPKNNSGSKVVKHLTSITPSLLKKVPKKSKNSVGSGGMFSKLIAAREALKNGIETIVVKGDEDKILLKIAQAKDFRGTRISSKR